MTIDASAIPAELRALPRWVRWKSVPAEPKPRKIPVRPSDPDCASSADPATWGTFETALANVGKHGTCGLGFVFSKEDRLVGVDLDDCLTEEGMPNDKAARQLSRFQTYAEESPSGTGLHLIARGSLNEHRGLNRKKETGIEVYDTGRFFTMTGRAFPGAPTTIAECQPALNELVAELEPPRSAPSSSPPRARRTPDHERLVERAQAYVAKMPVAISGQGGHEATFRVALALVKGFSLDTGTAVDLLRDFNTRCEPPWSEKELQHKIEDANKGDVPDGYILERDEPRLPKSAPAPASQPNAPVAAADGKGETPDPWLDPVRFREELRQITRTRVPTGIPTLDHATEGGISGDTVILLVGPIGSCKTALASQLSRGRALTHGGRVYVYAPDQGGAQYLKRLASTFGDIVEDDDAFARFVAGVVPVLRVIDERRDGVTIESFRDLVLAGGDVASVIIDTPQTVATAEDEEERQRIQKATGIARDLTSGLLVPVYVCSHANRASTAARNKQDRTLARSAGLGDASLEHRAQVMLFMERRDRHDGVTEIDVEIPKAPVAGLRCRLALDAEAWRLREVDLAVAEAEAEEKAARTQREKDQTKRSARWDQVKSIILSKRTRPVAHAVLKDEWKGAMNDLPRTLAAMVTAEVLVETPGAPPKGGGHPPKFYDLA